MLLHALRYASLGFSVIPLKPHGKEPLYPWKEFQQRRATEAEIKAWWSAVPNANIGIVTGLISGIAIADLDGREGLESAQKLGLTSTVTSLTGNGKHLWYKYSVDTPIANSVRSFPGVDVRGEGGYVVAPPSISPNGRRYRWLTPLNNVSALSVFPVSVIQGSSDTPTDVTNKENGWTKRPDGWIAKALGGMKDGNIDNTLVSILGRLRHDGWDADSARALLLPHCERVKASPGHLDEKIENVWKRYEPRRSEQITQSGYTQPDSTGLTIHSPTNPDSLKQFEQRVLEAQSTEYGQQLRTGYPKLDGMLKGGLKSSRLLTLAALTSHGKTNFGIALAKNICEQDKSVLYFSTEYTYEKIWTRYLATLKDSNRFKEHKFNVCDGFTPSIEQVEEAIIQIKPDVFIFDYIQHVSKEKEKLTEFMKGCQFLQRKYDTQGIILAQLNRSADWIENGKRVEPRMSMIEGSATIEQASSRVLLLSMTRTLPEYHEIDGYLVKNDDGDTGLVKFALYRNPYHIEEL